MLQTIAALERRGVKIEERTFDRLLADAIEHWPGSNQYVLPQSELSQEEITALQLGGFDLAPPRPGTADPWLTTVAEFAALLGTARTEREVATLLRVDESRVRQRRIARTLYAINAHGWRYPNFQFAADALVPGIGEVFAALPPELHPVAVARWFAQPDPDLALDDQMLSPLAWLRSGGAAARVVELAAAL